MTTLTQVDADFDRLFGDAWQPTMPVPPMPVPEFPAKDGGRDL